MGIFDPNMVHISHESIRVEELNSNASIYVEADVIDYSNSNTNLQSVILHWKYSAEDGPFGEIALELESHNIYTGTFPALNSNSSIDYFLTATNSSGNAVSHPMAGWHIFNTLEFSLGDINGDNSINIQDIVLAVNLVLSSEYNNLADLNSDSTVDILDIVHVVESIFNPTDEFDTDIAQDGIINVLDASIIFSSILDRVDNATAIRFFNEENGIHFESNGWVGGIEILLSHDADFGIELTDNSVLADNKTDDNQTKLIILAPESDELFTSLGIFEIISIIAVHESYIDIIQVYNQP